MINIRLSGLDDVCLLLYGNGAIERRADAGKLPDVLHLLHARRSIGHIIHRAVDLPRQRLKVLLQQHQHGKHVPHDARPWCG